MRKFFFHSLSAFVWFEIKGGLPLSAGSISFVACFGNRFEALFISESALVPNGLGN